MTGGCRARPSACPVGIVSKTVVSRDHGRPRDGSTILRLEAPSAARAYSSAGRENATV